MKPKSGKFGPRLTISLTGQDYNTLNALAEKEQVSASWVVRRAIEEFLRKNQMELDLPVTMGAMSSHDTTPPAGRHQR